MAMGWRASSDEWGKSEADAVISGNSSSGMVIYQLLCGEIDAAIDSFAKAIV
jgi:hypothetical protein